MIRRRLTTTMMAAAFGLATLGLAACAPAGGAEGPAVTTASAHAPNLPRDQAPTAAQTQACTARGGSYLQGGLMGGWMCAIRYSDAGKRCTSGDQCQGDCRSEGGVAPEAGAPATGRCQADSRPFGCFAKVEDGKATPALCID